MKLSMKVWCNSVTAGAKGKVKDTFDSIGTVTVKKNAEKLLGVLANVATPKPTSGISGTPVLRIENADIGMTKIDYPLAKSIIGDGIGTNDKESYAVTEFIPLKNPGPDPIGNSKMDFSLSSTTAVTEGWDAAIGLVFANEEPDDKFTMELLAQMSGRMIDSDQANSQAGIQAASETAFSETVDVTSRGQELIGLLSLLGANAPTAGEGIAGYTNFTAPDIEDFAPQLWPFCLGQHGSLGTPVGNQGGGNGRYYPTRFPLPRINFSMNISQKLAVVLSNAADGTAAAKWR